MSTSRIIKQLTKLISDISNGRVEEIESQIEAFKSDRSDSAELKELQQETVALAIKYLQANQFILNLSEGNLDVEAPRDNRLVDPLKELQASLRHLTWQTQEIAQGDYSQQIDFLGDFSTSFNSLVMALKEKKMMEEVLRDSEFFFKESQRAASIGSYKTNFLTGFWESSEMLNQIFGIDKANIRSIQSWISLIYPADQQMMRAYLLEEVIAKHQPFNKEYRIVRQNDGKIRWVHGLGKVNLDADGNSISMIGTIQDITERKLAEYTLQKSEEKYRDIFDNSIEAIFQTTLSGQLQIINPAFAHLFGYESPGEMITKVTNIKKQLYANSADRSRFVELLLKNGFIYDFEVQFKRKDDSFLWVSVNSRLVKNEEGTPLYLEGTFIDITKRKLAEAEIRFNEARLESLFKINQHPSESYHELLNFVLEEAISLTKSKLGYIYFYDDTKKEFILNSWSKDVMQQCKVMEPKTVYQLETTGIWGEAVRQSRPIMINDFKAFDPLKKGIPEGHAPLLKFLTIPVVSDGHVVAVVGVANKLEDYNNSDIRQLNLMMDAVWKIVQKKQSSEVIAMNEFRLKRAELASKSGNWELHLDSQTMIASEGAMIVYGLGNLSFKFSEIKNIPLPEYRSALDRTLKVLIENGQPYDIEFKIKTADTGEIKDIHSIAIFDKEKRIVFGIIQDITERKRAEEALIESQLQLSNAVKFAHLGSWEYNVANDLFTFNDSFYSIFRTTAKEVGGYTMSAAQYTKRFVYPEDAPVVGSGNQIAVESNDINFFKQFEHRMLYANGEVGFIKVRFFLIKDENGKTIKTYGVNQDITEQKQTEEILRKSEARLRELNAAKDKFFSIISHDLKSPFNSILGLSNLLVEQIQAKNNEGIEEYASIIQNSSQRAMDLLMNLLEWARSQTGKIEFSPEYVEIVALINEAIELLGDSALQKSITISKELPRTALVFADKAMISTVLRNLISNAIKFTHLGGQIVISAEIRNAELILAIRDNGVGIKKESIDKLFRIDENHSTLGTQNEKGTGLGLILCKEFIEKHDGKIWVESEVGKGSKFCFSIPKG
jgi:PAS domain S-box-containing protein